MSLNRVTNLNVRTVRAHGAMGKSAVYLDILIDNEILVVPMSLPLAKAVRKQIQLAIMNADPSYRRKKTANVSHQMAGSSYNNSHHWRMAGWAQKGSNVPLALWSASNTWETLYWQV